MRSKTQDGANRNVYYLALSQRSQKTSNDYQISRCQRKLFAAEFAECRCREFRARMKITPGGWPTPNLPSDAMAQEYERRSIDKKMVDVYLESTGLNPEIEDEDHFIFFIAELKIMYPGRYAECQLALD